jgi:hypothetical protein
MLSCAYDLRSHLTEFREFGYTIFHRLHDPSFHDGWRAFVDREMAGVTKKKVFGGLVERCPVLAFRAVANTILLDFAELVMGPFVQLDGLTLVVMPPGNVTAAAENDIHWHRDPWSHVPYGVYEHPLAINILTYLQNLDDELGPLRVLGGSHIEPLVLPSSLRHTPHPNERLLYLSQGDVVVTHNGLIHSRSPNRSSKSRSYLTVYYNKSWLRPSASHDGENTEAIIRRAIERNDVRLMRLFGRDTHLEARTNCGFMSPDELFWEQWVREDRSVLYL